MLQSLHDLTCKIDKTLFNNICKNNLKIHLKNAHKYLK